MLDLSVFDWPSGASSVSQESNPVASPALSAVFTLQKSSDVSPKASSTVTSSVASKPGALDAVSQPTKALSTGLQLGLLATSKSGVQTLTSVVNVIQTVNIEITASETVLVLSATFTATKVAKTPCPDKHSVHSDAMMSTPQIPTPYRRVPTFSTGISQQASVATVIQTITKPIAPDATSVLFKMYTPPSTTSTMSTRSAISSNSDGGNKNAAKHGAIVGVVILVVALLAFYVMRCNKNNSRGERSNAEMGKSHHPDDRSTNDVINEAKRMLSKRHRQNRQRDTQPYGWDAAGTVEPIHPNNVVPTENNILVQCAGRTNAQPTFSLGVDPVQAQGWDTSFGADNFQSQSFHKPARMPKSIKHRNTRRPPPIMIIPSNQIWQQSRRAQPGTSHRPSTRSRRPLSPMTDAPDPIYAPQGRTYDDVSPMTSTHQSRSHI